MVIDTSALLAILFGEPEALTFSQVIDEDPKRLVSSFSALEAAVVIHSRKGPSGIRELDMLLHSIGASIVSLDSDQVLVARSAYEKYGKGYHPASLNLGDCCSFALACVSGEPLLFKGEDFSRTDISVVRK